MTTEQLKTLFDQNEEEYLKYKRIPQSKRGTNRADLHAFNVLDSLIAGDREMVAGAAHDEIWLGVDLDDLAEIITEDQVIDLIRCGVRIDSETDSLAMFV